MAQSLRTRAQIAILIDIIIELLKLINDSGTKEMKDTAAIISARGREIFEAMKTS